MNAIFDIINVPLGYVLRFIASIFSNNFAASVFVFTLLINIAFIPLTIKSQKSAVGQLRVKPKLDELKKKYGNDKQKYSQAMSQLYQEENISMSGGCLPMIIRLVIMLSIYNLIMSPLTYLANVDSSIIKEATEALTNSGVKITRGELDIFSNISKLKDAFPEIARACESIDFNFFGIDLTQKPTFSLDIFNNADEKWIMPILAFVSQMISSVFSMKLQKKTNPDAPNMSGMMLTMPLISLFIGFSLAGGVTFYWACSSLIGGFIQIGVQQFYGPHKVLAKERTNELAKQCDFEAGQIKKLSNNK